MKFTLFILLPAGLAGFGAYQLATGNTGLGGYVIAIATVILLIRVIDALIP